MQDHWLPADTWILVFVVAVLLAAPPGTSLLSDYAFRCYAVPFVLLAVAGRKYKWAARISAGLGIAAALYFLVHLWSPTHIALWPFLVSGLVVVALWLAQLIGGIGGLRPLDPVVVAATQIAIGVVARWMYYAISGVGTNPAAYQPDTWQTPFVAELPILALAFAAAGLGVSRSWGASLNRLGITRPEWWQPFLALLVAGVFILLVDPINAITYRLMPDTYLAIAAVEDKTGAQSGLGIALAYGVLAGIAEETLFRGALQPRAGIVITALLFAMIHVQFGVSPILALVFIAGLAYGLIRRYINTTTAIMAHAGYNIVGLIGWLNTEMVAILVLVLALILVRPAMRWSSAHVVAAAFAPLLWLVAVGIDSSGANLASYAFLGASGSVLLALGVGVEAHRRGSVVLGLFGVVPWLLQAAFFASAHWLRPGRLFAVLAATVPTLVGFLVWYRLVVMQDLDDSEPETIGPETG